MIFFAFLDYGWYLSNLFVLDHAVAAGARAGVKARYWLTPSDDGYLDPKALARQVVRDNFWLSPIKEEDIQVVYKDADQQTVDEDGDFLFLEVRVPRLDYGLLTGYMPDGMIPRTIGALALTPFP